MEASLPWWTFTIFCLNLQDSDAAISDYCCSGFHKIDRDYAFCIPPPNWHHHFSGKQLNFKLFWTRRIVLIFHQLSSFISDSAIFHHWWVRRVRHTSCQVGLWWFRLLFKEKHGKPHTPQKIWMILTGNSIATFVLILDTQNVRKGFKVENDAWVNLFMQHCYIFHITPPPASPNLLFPVCVSSPNWPCCHGPGQQLSSLLLGDPYAPVPGSATCSEEKKHLSSI